MTQNVATYCPEIMTLIRSIAYQKDLLKEFKETDEGAVEMVQEIKDQQEALKSYLEEQNDSKEILDKIKDLENDLKLAVKGAAQGSEYKPAVLKKFYMARSKEDAVDKTVDIGKTFEELKGIVGS